MAATYSCGHPRTPENTWGKVQPGCRTCGSAQHKAEWAALDVNERRMDYLVRALPGQVEKAREKYIRLLKKANSLGMTDLLNDSWDRAILEAQAGADAQGGSIGFQDGRD